VQQLRGSGGSEPKKGVHSFSPAAVDPPPGRSAVEIRSLYHSESSILMPPGNFEPFLMGIKLNIQ